jgi:EmrB/QacA subfamily drug resistance transporter
MSSGANLAAHDAALEAPRVDDRARRIVPWLCATALFMELLDATIVDTAVPTMAAALKVAPLSLKTVLTSYTLALALFIPVSGWVADRFGTRRVFGSAIALFVLGSLACALALNVPMLVAARLVQGAGGAIMTPVARTVLVRTFPRSEFIRAMNYFVIPALIGPLVGPLLGGLVVHWLHWRAIFFLNLPIGVAGLWLVRRHMPDYRSRVVAPLDVAGFLVFGAGVALLSHVLEVFSEHDWDAGRVLAMTAASAALLVAYGAHARRWRIPCSSCRCSACGRSVRRSSAGSSPASGSAAHPSCCRCCTRWCSASRRGRQACSSCRRGRPQSR